MNLIQDCVESREIRKYWHDLSRTWLLVHVLNFQNRLPINHKCKLHLDFLPKFVANSSTVIDIQKLSEHSEFV